MEQELSNCPSADGTFLSSTFPNTCSLAATHTKNEGGLERTNLTGNYENK